MTKINEQFTDEINGDVARRKRRLTARAQITCSLETYRPWVDGVRRAGDNSITRVDGSMDWRANDSCVQCRFDRWRIR